MFWGILQYYTNSCNIFFIFFNILDSALPFWRKLRWPQNVIFILHIRRRFSRADSSFLCRLGGNRIPPTTFLYLHISWVIQPLLRMQHVSRHFLSTSEEIHGKTLLMVLSLLDTWIERSKITSYPVARVERKLRNQLLSCEGRIGIFVVLKHDRWARSTCVIAFSVVFHLVMQPRTGWMVLPIQKISQSGLKVID